MHPNVLLLQGPIGPFFSRFATDLESRGFNVSKVHFNGGDRFFYRHAGAIDYTGTLENWESWLQRLIVNRKISRVYLFGDCRAYHRIAREVVERLGVRLFVFEEGYIRPNFITLEEGGVNGNSTMMDKPLRLNSSSHAAPPEFTVPSHVFQITAIYSMIYYWASAFRRSRYPDYRHHRPFDWFAEGSRWLRSGLRKWRYKRRERSTLSELLPQFDGNYFLCPLQVHCDMQVVMHSDYNSIEHFVGDILASFSQHAPSNKAIVFKHHPLDRGYTDYTTLFDNLVAELGLQGRVFYVHDVCLPTLLKHAQGTVLINSTVGMSSLFHGTPVKTMGQAIYDIPGLTSQQPLDKFWFESRRVDMDLFREFRACLIARNQLNGNLYRHIGGDGESGIVWSAEQNAEHTWNEQRERAATGPRFTVINGGMAKSQDAERGDDAEAA